ncbi:hypothetical protein BV22DRAFT_1026299 [Leucogyrophana mollusca]|uniref:Uncharacterized protein n=1 Tax=Leucogyrophana mollusca TaxID=85980 RepID=A0ACB8AWV4_9AGAM|nr:hypothetical protein BV22DRAFT_1026299 [Leucogyrophana mollusca]
MFEEIREQQEANGLDTHAPFADEHEWGLVKWWVALVGQTAIDEFMKLPIIRSTSDYLASNVAEICIDSPSLNFF